MPRAKPNRLAVFLASIALLACSAGELSGAYLMPPENLRSVIEAPPPPSIRVSPDRKVMLLLHRPALRSIEDLAGPELALAGVRFNPQTRSPTRETTYHAIDLVDIATGVTRTVESLPEGAGVAEVTFSPDSRHIALAVVAVDRTELWLVDTHSAKSRRLSERPLNRAIAQDIRWLPDSSAILACFVPIDSGQPPEKPRRPAGPRVFVSSGEKTRPARTYPFLLKDVHDDALFSHYARSELLRVSLAGAITSTGESGRIVGFDPSPDGQWLLVTRITEPYSRLVPISRFARRTEAVSTRGGTRIQISDLPLAEDIPVGLDAARRGRRHWGWRGDKPATVWFVEAVDAGDPQAHTEIRDIVSVWDAPFSDPPRPLARLAARFRSVQWSDDHLAIVTERWWRTRTRRIWRVFPGEANSDPVLLFEYSVQDRYGDPGRFQTRRNSAGRPVLDVDPSGRYLYLVGAGASEEGDRPFVDRFEIDSGNRTRLFRSEAPYFEYPLALLESDASSALTSRESITEPPNVFVRKLGSGNGLRALTAFPHPQPALLHVSKQELRFEREDGLPMSATLYLPHGYEKGASGLPGLVWAYPVEYKSLNDAGQVQTSPYRFVRVSPTSPILFALAGYAVLHRASMPIVGEGDNEPNDNFIEQLGLNARAIVNEGARLGVLDPDRVAIAGHSYGAFMTANLLAHTEVFRAGIARSGAYNRTFTPFGFQYEERTFWEARDVYINMSPFSFAHQINEPLLLFHGDADNNSGTFPIQSERFFNALQGHAKVAQLVMYPYESHGYVARESVLDLAARTLDWLETHVRPPRP